MSQQGYLACHDCQAYFRLGDAVFRPGGEVAYFQRGDREAPRNSETPALNRALWKMLADHWGHNIRVVLDLVEEDPDGRDWRELGDYLEIGADEAALGAETPDAVTLADYLRDWQG
jgi:hypothetical protein